MWIEIYILRDPGSENTVTPLAGVWIEIDKVIGEIRAICVTPLAGVWIEINILRTSSHSKPSLPLRECGLK